MIFGGYMTIFMLICNLIMFGCVLIISFLNTKLRKQLKEKKEIIFDFKNKLYTFSFFIPDSNLTENAICPKKYAEFGEEHAREKLFESLISQKERIKKSMAIKPYLNGKIVMISLFEG